MADQVTLAFIGAGGAGLVLWYASRALERRRQINRLVKGAPIVAQRKDSSLDRLGERSAQLMNDLPTRLDPGWMEDQVQQNLTVFRESRGLFESWLLTLRDRYRTPQEIEVYDNAEKKLRARMSFLKTAIEADVAATTAREQHDIQTLKVKTEHITAQRDFNIASGTADITVENKLMAAQLENEDLRKKLEEARAAATAARRPLIETQEAIRKHERDQEIADARHAAELAQQRAEKAKHEAAARDHRRPKKTPDPATGKPAPPPPPTAAEKQALRLQAEQRKIEAINKAEVWMRKDMEEFKRDFGIDSEEYGDRDRYWNHRLITLRERAPETFLSSEDQERLRA